VTEKRILGDGDVTAIVDALEVRLTDKFYRDLGKGLWGMVWKALIGALVFVAAYGAMKYGDKA
jgi:hypothetical protein